MNKKEQILELPIEKAALSINTTILLKIMGYNKIRDVLMNGNITYQEIYEKIESAAKLFDNMTPYEVQHSYIELVQYLKFYGVKIIDEQQTQKTITR